MSRFSIVLLSLAALHGCYMSTSVTETGSGDPSLSFAEQAPFPGTPDPAPFHAAAGYLLNPRSAVRPWCQAVFVARDVALTSAHCVKRARQFEVGVEDVADAMTSPVVQVVRHLNHEQPEHGLAALILEEPLDVEPARFGEARPDACDLEVTLYEPTVPPQDGVRTRWSGCADAAQPEVVEFEKTFPRCHSEDGAGAFVGQQLYGIATGATRRGPLEGDSACNNALTLATVDANMGFLEEARALSRLAGTTN